MNTATPLATMEVQVSMTLPTIAQVVLMLTIIFLIYFILKAQFA